NLGPDLASDVVVTDTLPAGATAASASGPGWACGAPSGGVLTCTRASMDVGAAPPITLTLTAPSSGSLTNTASVRGSNVDPVAANDTAAETTTVSGAPVGADLEITIGGVSETVEAGQALT